MFPIGPIPINQVISHISRLSNYSHSTTAARISERILILINTIPIDHVIFKDNGIMGVNNPSTATAISNVVVYHAVAHCNVIVCQNGVQTTSTSGIGPPVSKGKPFYQDLCQVSGRPVMHVQDSACVLAIEDNLFGRGAFGPFYGNGFVLCVLWNVLEISFVRSGKEVDSIVFVVGPRCIKGGL